MTPLPFHSVQTARRPVSGVTPHAMSRTDPRWLLAARACMLACPGGVLGEDARDRLMRSASDLGFTPIHARAIINIGAAAAARGGLGIASVDELTPIPPPRPQTPRYLTLYVRSLVAVLALLAVLMAWWRFG